MSCCKHQLPQKLASSAVSDELLLRWLKGTYRGLKQLLLLHTKALAAETTRAARYLPTRVIGQACRARRLAHPACSSCTERSALSLQSRAQDQARASVQPAGQSQALMERTTGTKRMLCSRRSCRRPRGREQKRQRGRPGQVCRENTHAQDQRIAAYPDLSTVQGHPLLSPAVRLAETWT